MDHNIFMHYEGNPPDLTGIPRITTVAFDPDPVSTFEYRGASTIANLGYWNNTFGAITDATMSASLIVVGCASYGDTATPTWPEDIRELYLQLADQSASAAAADAFTSFEVQDIHGKALISVDRANAVTPNGDPQNGFRFWVWQFTPQELFFANNIYRLIVT